MAGSTRNPWEENYNTEGDSASSGKPWEQSYQEPAKPKDPSIARSVGDSAIALGTGVVQGAKMLSDVAGADNAVSRNLSKGAGFLADLESPYRKAEKQARAEKIKQAEESGNTWEEVKAHVGGFAEAPLDTTLNALGTSAPTIAAGLLTGGTSTAAVAGARVAQAGLGIAQGVGGIKGSIHEAVKQKHLEAGASDAEATQRADAAQAYSGDNLGSIATGGALGLLAGTTGAESAVRRIVGRQVAEEAAERAAPGLLRSTAMGAVKEAPMEGLQGGQERLASNLALQGEGFDVPTWQGVAGQAALESLASAPVGGGFGAMEALGRRPVQPNADPALEPGAPGAQDAGDETGPVLGLPAPDRGVIAVSGDGTARTPAYQAPGYVGDVTDVEAKPPRAVAADFASILDTDNVYSGWSNVQDGSDRATMRDQMDYVGRTYGGKTTPENAAEVAADLSQQFKWFRAASPEQKRAAINALMVPAAPIDPVREQVATAAAQGGALSSAALTAIDTGAAATLAAPTVDADGVIADAGPAVYHTYEDAQAYAMSQRRNGATVTGLPVPAEGGGFSLAMKGTPQYQLGEALRAERMQAERQAKASTNQQEKAPLAQDTQALPATNIVAASANLKSITAKQIPAMTDVELQQAIEHYGPEHKRTAKLQKEVQRRAADTPTPTTGAFDGPQADQTQQTSAQPTQAAAAPDASAGLTDGTTTPQNLGAQAAPAGGSQGKAPRASAEQLTAAQDRWQRMTTAERQAVAARTDVKPILRKNLHGAKWENLNVDVQRKLQAAMEPIEAQPSDMKAFKPETGTLGVPRSEMPQVPSQSHGGLVKHLNSQGISHETTTVDAGSLKPTQAEYSPAKVEAAKGAEGGRAVIVSKDGHIIDGHHQAMAAAEDGKPVKAIVLDAPVEQALEAVKNSPSAQNNDRNQAPALDAKAPEAIKKVAEQAAPKPDSTVTTMRSLAQQFRDRHAVTKKDTDRTFAGVLDQFAQDVEQGKRTPQSVQQAIERYQELAAEPFQATQTAPATHADPGQAPEVATPAVVAQSVQKAARNEDTKPSEMRKWLVGKIDEAIAVAPEAAVDFLSFDVPGDGTFKVQNSQARLQEFRKKVMTSPGFKDGGQKQNTKPLEQVDSAINGSGSTVEALRNFLTDGDVQGAIEFAKLKGVEFTPVEPRASMTANGKFKHMPASVKSSVPSVAEGLTQVEAEQINQYLTAESARKELAATQDADVQPSPQDFIPAPDGGLDYGEITPEMGKAMRRQAGKIRLQHGVQNSNGTGWGLVHIEANHGKQISGLGFGAVQDFVAHVASSIQQVWQVPGNSQLLLTLKDGRKDVMYIQLEIAKEGDFYRVNSAFPVRQEDYESLKGMKKIWDGSEPTSAVTGQRPAFATAASASPESESSQGSSNARGQDASVPPAPATPQPITRADVTAAQQQAAAIITERIDAMTAGEVNTIARRFLPTMGVRPTVSKERNKAAVVDFTKVNPMAAAEEFGATLPADVRRALQADMEGTVEDGPAAAAQKSAKPIEDAGEKIGGARKDRWKERGLNLEDLDAMTEAEGAELATKANVWKPDYEALSEASEPVTAAMVKTIYDQLAAKPKKNTPEGRRQYVQMMRIVRDVYTEADGPEAVKNAYQEIRKRAGLNTLDPKVKADGRELLFSVYKGRSDPFVFGFNELQRAKKLVEDGFPAKAAPWKSRLSVGRREGGNGTTERGIEMYMELSAEVGTPLTREQILGGFYRVSTKDNKAVAFAASKADAEAAAATVYERDMKGKKDSKPEPVRPNLDELKRENLPRRIDRDVKADDFVNDLGFRGIEFGNWSAQDERQRILNMAYDGLMDLAEIMGVPPKAMSLNGTLGMAFGARGGGRFAAHYEPGKLVINMTKIRGGGSMAHEWAHAMDHYFGELDKADAYTTTARGASGWYSEDQYLGVPRKRMERVGNEWKNVEKMRLDNLRPEMAAAFDEVMRGLFKKQITKAEMVRSLELDLERTEALARSEQVADLKAMYQNMVQNKRQALNEMRGDPEGTMYAGRGRSDYASQAQALSGKSVDGYWVRPTEMFARAFESWVFDRVTAMGAKSDYLVHGVEEDRFAGGAYKGNPYPTGEERARINAAFDKLAQTIKTKETDKGVAMFSRAPSAAPAADSNARNVATQLLVDGLKAKWTRSPEIIVARNMQDPMVPQAVRDYDETLKSQGATGEPRGFIYQGKVYLLSDQLKGPQQIAEVLFHEVLGHYGLRGAFGNSLDSILQQIGTMRRRDVVAKAREYGLFDKDALGGLDKKAASDAQIWAAMSAKDRLSAAEEVLAEMAQTQPNIGFVQRAISAIRNWLRTNVPGFKSLRLTDADIIQAYILPARGFVTRSKETGAQSLERAMMAFSRTATDQTQTEAFKRWFAGSRVVDADGKPLVVYHGTGADFSVFTRDRAGATSGAANAGMGFFFTDQPEVAGRYAAMSGGAQSVMPVYLSLQNPIRLTAKNMMEADKLLQSQMKPEHDGAIIEVAMRDGGVQTVFMAKESSQVKSSTGNNGDFDPANPDIRFSRTTAQSIASSMGDMTPDQEKAYKNVAGVKAVPTVRERMDALKANLGLKLRQGLVDQFAAIKQLDQNAYVQARMSKGTDGTLEAILMYGKPFMRDGAPDVDIKDGGFAKVLASLKGEQDRWMMWIAAQRAEKLKADGKENLMTDDDISALKTLNAGKMADGTARMLIYAKALQELNAYNDAMLKLAMDSGLIDQAAYDLMAGQPYVPFYRLMEDGDMKGPKFSSGLTNQKAWQKLKGGTQQLNADLLQNMLLNWSHLLQASAKNRAATATMDAAEKMAVAYKVDADTKGSVKVMRDGSAEHWMVEDPYLLDAISAIHYVPSPLMKPLAKFKQLLTWGVTVNPTFKIRNLIRDSVSAIAQSELGYNPGANVAKGWKLTAKDSQIYASMLASGGLIKFGTQENTDRLRAQVAKLGGVMLDKGGAERFFGQIKDLYDVYNEFGDRAENVNRAALYDALIKKGKTHAEAAFMARDLMDFSMGGSAPVVRFLTQTVPFLNARLVGLDKLGRAAMEDPRRFAAVTGAVALASLALMAGYSDDEDWKKREDWDRDAYWWFKIGGQAYRIPKPFEVGAIGTLAERTAELMLSDEMTGKRYMERVSHMLSGTFSFNPVPQAFKPLLDLYANKDSFTGRAIESQADQRLRPQDRYSDRTPEVAKFLGGLGLPDPAQLVKGEYSALSPKQVEHLIRGYFSWVGTAAMTVSDFGLRPLAGRGERPDMRLKDVFIAGNFVENLPTGSSRYVTQMYEQSRQVEHAYASYQEAIKAGDTEKAQSIKESAGPLLRNRPAYTAATRQLAEINRTAKRIEADQAMAGAAKRARLTQLEQQRQVIAQRVSRLAAATP